MKTNSVIEYKNYGKVVLHLDTIMDAKGINRNTISKLTNVRFEVIDKWYSGSVERMDLDILAKLCFVLNCQVNDLLEYVSE